MTEPKESKGGLEGIVAGSTALSWIDGVAGKLTYRGISIHELADRATFEETCFLLWNDTLPTGDELATFTARLAAQRDVSPDIHVTLKTLAKSAEPMEYLRTAVSLLSLHDTDKGSNELDANMRKAERLTAQTATLIAAYARYRQGLDFVAPNPELGHAANFLYMLTGKVPDAEMARFFDVCLVLHADHSFNASTFAARVIAGTLADMHSAVVGAIGALKGPLHGGANTNVMRLLEEIGEPANVKAAVTRKLEAKDKIPGFGHRVYKTLDPRAVHLKRMSETLGARDGNAKYFEMSIAIQKLMKDAKGLDANVDFFSATSYHYMGIKKELFTPIFALSRVSGWVAHVAEQHANNRLIRPDADYTGQFDRAYTPMKSR